MAGAVTMAAAGVCGTHGTTKGSADILLWAAAMDHGDAQVLLRAGPTPQWLQHLRAWPSTSPRQHRKADPGGRDTD